MSVTSPTRSTADRRGQVRRVTTYLAGSVVATVCSELTLVVCYGVLHLSPGVAAALAWLAGALPNYWLNRTWTWQQSGRPSLRREVLPYVVIIVVTVLLAAGASHVVARILHARSDATRTAALAVTFLGVYVVMFVVRYALLNRLFQGLARPVPGEPGPVETEETR